MIKEWVKNRFNLYSLEELQVGGWCGLCGKWLPDIIVPKWWPYSVCKDCEVNDEITPVSSL